MKVYLDTSVALRRLLRHPDALSPWGRWDRAYASALLRVEALRTADRLRLEGVLDDERRAELSRQIATLVDSLHLVPVTDAILKRAGEPFPTILGTLDAIHLATAMAVEAHEEAHLTLLTHDAQLGQAARSMSLPVEGI